MHAKTGASRNIHHVGATGELLDMDAGGGTVVVGGGGSGGGTLCLDVLELLDAGGGTLDCSGMVLGCVGAKSLLLFWVLLQ